LFTFLFPSKFFPHISSVFFLPSSRKCRWIARRWIRDQFFCFIITLFCQAAFLFNKQVLISAPFCRQIVNFRHQMTDMMHTSIMAHCLTGNGTIKLQRMKSYTLFDTSLPYKIRLSGV
jgi:hypothetical protein